MSQSKAPSRSFERELGEIRVEGRNPNPVIALIQAFLDECEQPFENVSGRPIQVLLDPSALENSGFGVVSGATLILDLQSIELVRLCSEHQGPVRWFCGRNPRDLVGPMLDHYRGTYFRAHTGEIVYSSDSDLELIKVPRELEITSVVLAAVCAAREGGISAQAIHRALNKIKSANNPVYHSVKTFQETHI